MEATLLQQFFDERITREDDIKELRAEMKEQMEAFCSSIGADKQAVNMAFRLFKALQKDQKSAEAMQFEYDKLAELLITKGEN